MINRKQPLYFTCFYNILLQVDKDIYIPGKNLERNLELREQATGKEQHNITYSQQLNFDIIEYE